MQTATMNLMEAVDRVRIKRGLSDRRFSREVLGISPSYYCLLKNGGRAATMNILQILMQKLPEITPEVTIYFMRQGNDGEKEGK